MKTILAQINTTPRDWEGNFKQIIDGIYKAINEKADLVVFPELSIPGYLIKDLIFNERRSELGFVETNLQYLKRIADITTGNLTVVVGYVDRNTSGIGKPFRNAAAVIRNGMVIATYYKHLLPFYDVFDEGRYFEPGDSLTVVEICGLKFGITICEDLWNDKEMNEVRYSNDPIAEYDKIGIKHIINISSSPYCNNKPQVRHGMISNIADNRKMTIIYVNQRGGQDELVFDGGSMIVHISRTAILMSDQLYGICDFSHLMLEPADYHRFHNIDHKMLILGLKDYVRKSGFKQVVLGSSGGIDSALTACIACEALGPENVLCLIMPSINSSEHSITDAKALHKALGCREMIVPIEHLNLIAHIKKDLPEIEYNQVADQNIQARIRGLTVMWYANAFNMLALTTGNKTEMALGYCTLYGDMNGGFNVISDLYKHEVYSISRTFYGSVIPPGIFTKPPSAELAPNQTDEADLLPYPILDTIVQAYIEDYINTFDRFVKLQHNDIVKNWINTPNALSRYYEMIRRIDINEFKRRQAAPGIKIKKIAFGTGRRIPIVKGPQ